MAEKITSHTDKIVETHNPFGGVVPSVAESVAEPEKGGKGARVCPLLFEDGSDEFDENVIKLFTTITRFREKFPNEPIKFPDSVKRFREYYHLLKNLVVGHIQEIVPWTDFNQWIAFYGVLITPQISNPRMGTYRYIIDENNLMKVALDGNIDVLKIIDDSRCPLFCWYDHIDVLFECKLPMIKHILSLHKYNIAEQVIGTPWEFKEHQITLEVIRTIHEKLHIRLSHKLYEYSIKVGKNDIFEYLVKRDCDIPPCLMDPVTITFDVVDKLKYIYQHDERLNPNDLLDECLKTHEYNKIISTIFDLCDISVKRLDLLFVHGYTDIIHKIISRGDLRKIKGYNFCGKASKYISDSVKCDKLLDHYKGAKPP